MAEGDPMPGWASLWVADSIGAFRQVRVHRDGAHRTGVWEVESRGQRYVFKTHNRRYKWGSEVLAYRSWGQAFSPYLAEVVRVLDQPDHFGLLLRSVAGQPLREAGLPDWIAAVAYREAAQCLRRLTDSCAAPCPWFGSAVGDDGLPLSPEQGLFLGRDTDAAALFHRLLDDAERQARQLDVLTPAQWELVAVVRPLADAFAGERPVPTHNDFTPGNWLVDADGRLTAIIDLENMFHGVCIEPFLRLCADYFPTSPRCQEAFIEGFGIDLPQQLPHQIAVGLTLHGIAYLFSGVQRNDAGHRQRGLDALRLAEQVRRRL